MLRLFDLLPDVLFFIKDTQCRYTHVNQTLTQRLGIRRREDILGKSVLELYPPALSTRYILQDRRVLKGEVIDNVLELQLYPNRTTGWCLTRKQPLEDDGRIVGLIGISRDLGRPDSRHSSFAQLQDAVEYMQGHFTRRSGCRPWPARPGFPSPSSSACSSGCSRSRPSSC